MTYPEFDESLLPEGLRSKYAHLRGILVSLESAAIGFSGGVDSALLAGTAAQVLGDKALACLAVSPSLARREYAGAVRTAQELGLRLEIYSATEFSNPAYVRNDARRCFHCKSDLYFHLGNFARSHGLKHLLYGGNVDDLSDYRPGHDAAADAGARAPLAEAGLRKAEIREMARLFGISVHGKPATPCLSSRIPYGSAVTEEKLAAVEAGEEALQDMGFSVFRVRHEGDTARLEVPVAEFALFSDTDATRRLLETLKGKGFRKIHLDLEGFRSGNLNEALPGAEAVDSIGD